MQHITHLRPVDLFETLTPPYVLYVILHLETSFGLNRLVLRNSNKGLSRVDYFEPFGIIQLLNHLVQGFLLL